ncbi:hypothetical protein EDD85DRAFT_938439 [Armillaria nabsnona]|nr:hypothetical protein EDD85DRAFT_938439 [Armillaria nabsnona]
MASLSCCDHMYRLEEKFSIMALEELACRLAQSPSAQVQTPAMQGSFNLVYAITFPDGRKWVARIPEPSFTDSRKIESMIGTMRLISDRTSLPLPVVYAYDSTSNNSLGYPYMFTSFIEGVSLSGIWTKPGALTDANRRHIFQQIANSMAQLRTLEFDRIGALDFSGPDLSYTIGPLRTIEEGKVVHEIGPFPTSLSYINELASALLDTHGQSTSEPSLLPDSSIGMTCLSVLEKVDMHVIPLGSLEIEIRLCMIGLQGQSLTKKILTMPVPKDGEPRQNGSSCEEAPEVLQAHRDLYYAIYADIDPTGAEVTCRSHIFEAVVIALEHRDLSVNIMLKLCSYLFGKEYMGMGELLFGIEAGDWFTGMRGVHEMLVVSAKFIRQLLSTFPSALAISARLLYLELFCAKPVNNTWVVSLALRMFFVETIDS